MFGQKLIGPIHYWAAFLSVDTDLELDVKTHENCIVIGVIFRLKHKNIQGYQMWGGSPHRTLVPTHGGVSPPP